MVVPFSVSFFAGVGSAINRLCMLVHCSRARFVLCLTKKNEKCRSSDDENGNFSDASISHN